MKSTPLEIGYLAPEHRTQVHNDFVSGICNFLVGTYTVKINRKGQEPVEDKGKYILVWKHTAKGWKVHRDIWNSSTPRRK